MSCSRASMSKTKSCLHAAEAVCSASVAVVVAGMSEGRVEIVVMLRGARA